MAHTHVGKVKISNVVGDNSMISVGDSLFMPKPGAECCTKH